MTFDDRVTNEFDRDEKAKSIILKFLEKTLRNDDNVRAMIRNNDNNQNDKIVNIIMSNRDA
jgi:DNA-directed RNA polymerase subunit E'/Rpb7